MKPPGRNDPCYCGSNKKYKHCHGTSTVLPSEAVYSRIRRLDWESASLLLKFARRKYGEDFLEEAWEDFRLADGTPFDMDGPEADAFTRWSLFNFKPGRDTTVAELFLNEAGTRIDRDLYRFIESTANSPYSFYQVLEVQPDEGLSLRDILRRCDVNVKERSASKILQPGHITLARVVELDGIHFFMGVGADVIQPGLLDKVLTLREFLKQEASSEQNSISTETLLEKEEVLREVYFDISDMQRRPPKIQNTDGDPLVFCTLTYEIPSLEIAFHALKDLEQKVLPREDEAFFDEAERDKAGRPMEILLHWLRKGHKGGFGDNTTLAALRISKRKLVVEVNSERRAKRIQKEIEKRLGDEAVLLRTETRSHESIFKELENSKEEPRPNSEHDRLMKESPEARDIMKQMMDQHWKSWLEEPIPALRGMTPRIAAKDPEGLELLGSLLMDFDLRNQSVEDEFLKVNTAMLRRELGLEHE
ncbi:MAG: SEC-C domain-containing protein [bacterium]